MAKQYEFLTEAQVEQFLNDGYIVIKQAFTPAQAAEFSADVWTRLGVHPNDVSTWDASGQEKINMPGHHKVRTEDFAPRAWGAMLELLGGRDRVDENSGFWSDAFIVNLGTKEWETKSIHPRDLHNWHVDGDFFVHYLDSPEQGLLVIPLFTDIKPRGGGTFIAPDSLPMIASYLRDHPEGVLPTGLSFTPSTSTCKEPSDDPDHFSHLKEVKRCSKFVEVTGEVGDVFLLHPLMLHSASRNHLRAQRVITNPPVSLREPFSFARNNPNDHSLVERATLRALGVERLDFQPTTARRRVVPARIARQQKMMEEELVRLENVRLENGSSIQE